MTQQEIDEILRDLEAHEARKAEVKARAKK